MSKQRDVTLVFWGPHSRHTEDAANRLGASFHVIHYFGFSWRKASWVTPIKYVLQCFKTWAILVRERPSAVYVIIPPTFSALSVYLYCLLARVPFVMDVHGHSLTSKKWAWTIPLQRFLARRALATIVDQAMYRQTFESWGARTLVLERAPVDCVPAQPAAGAPGPFSVTVVSIFAEDEPVDLVVEAARQLPDVHFFITGDTARASSELIESAPSNVTFAGYLRGDEYWQRLHGSNAVMTLTTEPYSLVSGGVESMSLGKPTILSRQPVLVEYFTRGAVFVDHTVESISAGVRQAQANEARLAEEISELGAEKRRRWLRVHRELQQLLAGAAGRATSVPSANDA